MSSRYVTRRSLRELTHEEALQKAAVERGIQKAEEKVAEMQITGSASLYPDKYARALDDLNFLRNLRRTYVRPMGNY